MPPPAGTAGPSPGAIGVGLYIVFPAFYTDVTDSYRLGRAGRVRTDLGGLYFNAWCVVALGLAYLQTGEGVLLLSGLVMQIQMLQQLIPVVRFDGYYVLADLAGVPDLFSRVGPVLRSLRPGSPPDPRVRDLKPAARRLVTGWVLVVVPVLAFVIGWMLWTLPEILASARIGLEGPSGRVRPRLARARLRDDGVVGALHLPDPDPAPRHRGAVVEAGRSSAPARPWPVPSAE